MLRLIIILPVIILLISIGTIEKSYATCGVEVKSGGGGLLYSTALKHLELSPNRHMTLDNTGDMTATLRILADDWFDSTPTKQADVSDSKYDKDNDTTFQNTYGDKTPLTKTAATVTTAFLPTGFFFITFQLQPTLLDTTFTGLMTQTMTLSVTC